MAAVHSWWIPARCEESRMSQPTPPPKSGRIVFRDLGNIQMEFVAIGV